MATVQTQLLGGEITKQEASTAGELATKLGIPNTHETFVNGEAVGTFYELKDFEFVSFAKKQEGAGVKGLPKVNAKATKKVTKKVTPKGRK